MIWIFIAGTSNHKQSDVSGAIGKATQCPLRFSADVSNTQSLIHKVNNLSNDQYGSVIWLSMTD